MALLNLWKASLAFLALVNPITAFTNPIRDPGGSDPQVSYFDGYYYLISTEWENLQLARAETIEGLKTAQAKVIYSDTDPLRCCSVWAPELHYFDGIWYLYYTAGGAENLDNQRSHVLRGRFCEQLYLRLDTDHLNRRRISLGRCLGLRRTDGP